MTFDAFHLPGLESQDVAEWQSFVDEAAGVTLRWPLLTPDGVARVAKRTRAAADTLACITVREIIQTIDSALHSMRKDAVAYTQLIGLIGSGTGYSPAMTEYVMERMLADWRAEQLEALITDELGAIDALDDFVQGSPPRRMRAVGPDLSVHIFSGNVPGVAVTSIIRALLVKAPVLGKTAAGERVLAPAFARAVAAADPRIGDALAVTYWPGGQEDLERAAFASADVVIHYGGSAAIADVRRRIPPHVRLLEHGPRISFGYVARESLNTADARDLAGDVASAAAMFDQQGCVSPHVVFVETGGDTDPRAFTLLIAQQMEKIEHTLPRGSIDASEAADVRAARDRAEFRAIAGRDVVLHAPDSLAHTVIFDGEAAFTASCLNRTLTIHPVGEIDDVVSLLSPYRDVLQSAAVAAPAAKRDEIASRLARTGVTRITTFAALPWPPMSWHHDGRGPLVELIQWVDLD